MLDIGPETMIMLLCIFGGLISYSAITETRMLRSAPGFLIAMIIVIMPLYFYAVMQGHTVERLFSNDLMGNDTAIQLEKQSADYRLNLSLTDNTTTLATYLGVEGMDNLTGYGDTNGNNKT